MSCGALYTRNCGCSKWSLEDKILVPVPDSSQQPLILEKMCLNCGDPVHGLYCRKCAIIRQTLGEVFQDLLNTSESSNDNTNIVSAPQEPFVFNQDPGKNSSQSLPHIDHCCYGCGDSLDDIFYQRCTCESCGKDENSFTYDSKPNFVDDSPKVFNPPPQPPMYSCEFCGNNARYGHYCTPQVRTFSNPNILSDFKLCDTSSDDADFEDIEYGLVRRDVILREKLLNISRLITNIESLKDNPIPNHVFKSPSSFPIPVTDSDSFFEKSDTSLSYSDNSLPEFEPFSDDTEETRKEVDTFLVPEDSIPPGIESNFDPGGGEIVVSQNVEDDDSFTFIIRTFLPFLTYPADSPLLLSTGSEDIIFDPGNLTLRAGSASLWEWKLSCALMFIQTLMISSD
ncbi:hypothetical protein Tco_0995268 [Tanacetum coccineum]